MDVKTIIETALLTRDIVTPSRADDRSHNEFRVNLSKALQEHLSTEIGGLRAAIASLEDAVMKDKGINKPQMKRAHDAFVRRTRAGLESLVRIQWCFPENSDSWEGEKWVKYRNAWGEGDLDFIVAADVNSTDTLNSADGGPKRVWAVFEHKLNRKDARAGMEMLFEWVNVLIKQGSDYHSIQRGRFSSFSHGPNDLPDLVILCVVTPKPVCGATTGWLQEYLDAGRIPGERVMKVAFVSEQETGSLTLDYVG